MDFSRLLVLSNESGALYPTDELDLLNNEMIEERAQLRIREIRAKIEREKEEQEQARNMRDTAEQETDQTPSEEDSDTGAVRRTRVRVRRHRYIGGLGRNGMIHDENERLRRRRWMIEEMRRKSREAEEYEERRRAAASGDRPPIVMGGPDGSIPMSMCRARGGVTVFRRRRSGEKKKKEDPSFWRKMASAVGDMSSGASSGARNAMGVFRQINKKGKPIFEHISGGTNGMRQINKVGKKAIFKPNKAASGLANGIGKACLVAAIAVDVIEVGMAVKEDYAAGTHHHTVHAASGVAGSWAGGVPGAMYGAALGSVIPGPGSLIGGIIGGIVGGVSGGFFARTLAEKIVKAPEEKKSEEFEIVDPLAESQTQATVTIDDLPTEITPAPTAAAAAVSPATSSEDEEQEEESEETLQLMQREVISLPTIEVQ